MAVTREQTVLERPQEEVHERHEEETGEDQDAADLTKGGTCRASACARVCGFGRAHDREGERGREHNAQETEYVGVHQWVI